MAVTSTEMLQPAGELWPALWPGVTSGQLTTNLTEYIADGVQQATAKGVLAANVDKATLAWAYYRAYHSVYIRLITAPRKATIQNQGSREYEQKQADAMLAEANRHLAEFEALVPIEEASAPARPESASFRHRTNWM